MVCVGKGWGQAGLVVTVGIEGRTEGRVGRGSGERGSGRARRGEEAGTTTGRGESGSPSVYVDGKGPIHFLDPTHSPFTRIVQSSPSLPLRPLAPSSSLRLLLLYSCLSFSAIFY